MSTQPSFLWHDYETFGANPRMDRPAQFAGIRTDLDFKPIGEPVEWFCQPCEDVLPHPQACLITGITPQDAQERGLPEPEFIARVLTELGASQTCAVGYNSLRFDDEVTRHTAWRNFHDPYAREWRNGCSRWDIIDMVRMTYALRPEGIQWPLREDGKPSFRLEDLAAANALEQEQAHDALSDVRATIALARLIRERQPRLYDYVFSHRAKAAVWQLINLRSHEPVLHVSEKFGAEFGCLSLVMPIAKHPGNSNAVLCYDLRHDPADLLALSAEDIHERIFTPSADLPEDVARIAVKAVHANKCPVLAPVKTLSEEQAQRVQLDLNLCRRHWAAIHGQIEEVAAKLQAVFELGEFGPQSDPEQDLYGGFVADGDRQRCDQILQLTPLEFADFEPGFKDRRLDELWFRYRARHYPDSLNEAERDEWNNWRSRRIGFAADGGLSLEDYQLLIEALKRERREPRDARVLADLQAWGSRLAESL